MDTTIDDHDPLANDILGVLKSFIDEIGRRGCTAHFENVVDGKYRLKGRELVQKPERFIEDHLVYPLLTDAFGYSVRPQPKQYAPRWPRKGGIPDFCITSIPIPVAQDNDLRLFGEVKKPKDIDNAVDDMIEYLNSDVNTNAVVVLTDGFDWQLWVRSKGESVDRNDGAYAEASLQSSLQSIRARNMEIDSKGAHELRSAIDTDSFADFTRESLIGIVEDEFGIDTATTDIAN